MKIDTEKEHIAERHWSGFGAYPETNDSIGVAVGDFIFSRFPPKKRMSSPQTI